MNERMDSTNTITLGSKTYNIVKRGDNGMDLQGARGAMYCFVQNIHNPNDWTLITGAMKPRTERYTRTADGQFEEIE